MGQGFLLSRPDLSIDSAHYFDLIQTKTPPVTVSRLGDPYMGSSPRCFPGAKEKSCTLRQEADFDQKLQRKRKASYLEKFQSSRDGKWEPSVGWVVTSCPRYGTSQHLALPMRVMLAANQNAWVLALTFPGITVGKLNGLGWCFLNFIPHQNYLEVCHNID